VGLVLTLFLSICCPDRYGRWRGWRRSEKGGAKLQA
jgi:hypothetical protein